MTPPQDTDAVKHTPTITRTITWHPAETAPKDGDWFTAGFAGQPGASLCMSSLRWVNLAFPSPTRNNEIILSLPNFYDVEENQKNFTHWTRDRITP